MGSRSTSIDVETIFTGKAEHGQLDLTETHRYFFGENPDTLNDRFAERSSVSGFSPMQLQWLSVQSSYLCSFSA